MSLRAQRGNPGGALDCFGTNVPRNDMGGRPSQRQKVIASLFLLSLPAFSIVIASEAWQSHMKAIITATRLLRRYHSSQ